MKIRSLARVADLKLYSVDRSGSRFRMFHTKVDDFHLSAEGHLDWEPLLAAETVNLLKSNHEGAFFDVGSSFGYYSCIACSISRCRQVISFEPYFSRRILCKLNLAINGFSASVINKYVADITRENRVAIDDVCKSRAIRPSFIKMDIEGGEYWAIDGMKNTCFKYRPVLMIEVHDRIMREELGLDVSIMSEKIRSYGYRISFIDHHIKNGGLVYTDQKPNDINYEIVCR